jgi:hypothetical protein
MHTQGIFTHAGSKQSKCKAESDQKLNKIEKVVTAEQVNRPHH